MDIPETLSHYKIVRKLGTGAMGEVYLARDTQLDRLVALKILPPEVSGDEQRLGRFIREAKAASALSHANVAHIYEIGESEGVNFIAMEYVEGGTLAVRLEGRSLPVPRILDVGIQVADALDEAHSKGIVHRDIKPANLMVTERGQVKVLDFGLAKLTRPSRDSEAETLARTEEGVVVGTIQYMSPEQALGREVDARSDIFSLGVVLYELATGRPPFLAPSPTETIDRIAHSQPEAVGRLSYEAPEELERIIRKCLEKAPESRYQSARELLVDLKNLKRDSDSGTVLTPRATGRRISWIYAALVIVLIVFAVVGFYIFTGDARSIESLAVLPFENVGADPDTDYLSDGITETIISNLSQLPDVRVISRNSAFHYKGQAIDARDVGRELDVDAIVLGRIVERGDGLTISTELVDARDNSQIWGARYTRELSDIFAVQDEIAGAISQTLRLRLSGEDVARMTKRHTEDAEAYQAYLKGRFYWYKRTDEGYSKATQHFEEAIEKDPTYALAYSGLADAYSMLGLYFLPPGEAFPKARAAATKALEIDDTLAEAHVSLAYTSTYYYWDFTEAEKEFQRAIDLNPVCALAHHWYADYLSVLGRHDEAIAESRRALKLDPLSLVINDVTGIRLFMAGFDNEAMEQLQRTLEMDPEFPLTHWHISLLYLEKGLYDEAISHLRKAVEISASTHFMGSLGYAYGVAGKEADAVRILETLHMVAEQQYVSPLPIAYVHAWIGRDRSGFRVAGKSL
jgi:serine/threonine protein kinase/tetratricopeptide (TPR) repeat protein